MMPDHKTALIDCAAGCSWFGYGLSRWLENINATQLAE